MADYSVETKRKFTEEELRQIYQVEILAFPKTMQESPDSLREILANPLGIHIVLKKREEIIGYLTALPYNEALEYLGPHDPRLRPDSSALYLESIAVVPQERQSGNFSRLFRQLVYEAQNYWYQEYQKIVTHARVKILSPIMGKYGARRLYTVQNWYGFGEPFDFVEYLIPKKEEKVKPKAAVY